MVISAAEVSFVLHFQTAIDDLCNAAAINSDYKETQGISKWVESQNATSKT